MAIAFEAMATDIRPMSIRSGVMSTDPGEEIRPRGDVN
jgi:hypothetical protein